MLTQRQYQPQQQWTSWQRINTKPQTIIWLGSEAQRVPETSGWVTL